LPNLGAIEDHWLDCTSVDKFGNVRCKSPSVACNRHDAANHLRCFLLYMEQVMFEFQISVHNNSKVTNVVNNLKLDAIHVEVRIGNVSFSGIYHHLCLGSVEGKFHPAAPICYHCHCSVYLNFEEGHRRGPTLKH